MGHAHSCTLDSGANLGIYCYIILGAHVKYYVVEPSYCKPREHFWCSNVMDTMVWRGEKGRQSGFFQQVVCIHFARLDRVQSTYILVVIMYYIYFSTESAPAAAGRPSTACRHTGRLYMAEQQANSYMSACVERAIMHTFYYRPERMHATNFRAAARV